MGCIFTPEGLVLGNAIKFCLQIPLSFLENTGKYLCDSQNPFGFSGTNTSKRNTSQQCGVRYETKLCEPNTGIGNTCKPFRVASFGSKEKSHFKTVLWERISVPVWTSGSTEVLKTDTIMRWFSLFVNIFSWRFQPNFRDLSICEIYLPAKRAFWERRLIQKLPQIHNSGFWSCSIFCATELLCLCEDQCRQSTRTMHVAIILSLSNSLYSGRGVMLRILMQNNF